MSEQILISAVVNQPPDEPASQIVCRKCGATGHWTSKCTSQNKRYEFSSEDNEGRFVPPHPSVVKKEIEARDREHQANFVKFVREEWPECNERMMMICSGREVKVPVLDPWPQKSYRHLDLQCESCGYMLGNGVRWRCEECVNYNLCGVCESEFADEKHCNGKHTFVKILDSRKFHQ